MNPGIYPGLSNEDYHSGPGYSKSQLDLAHKSPALIPWSRRAPRSVSEAADVGTAFHALLLEPERFAAEYSPRFQPPAGALSTVDDMRAWLDGKGIEYKKADTKGKLEASILEADPSAPILDRLRREWEASPLIKLTDDQWTAVHEMRDSVMAHPEAEALLTMPGEAELSAYATDPNTGLLVRIRPDRWLRDVRIIADLKSTDDISKFQWSVRDYRYDVQDAFYRDVAALADGDPLDAFLFVVCGKRREMGRYPVSVFEIPPSQVDEARSEYEHDLETIAKCERTGHWPGVQLLNVPPRYRA